MSINKFKPGVMVFIGFPSTGKDGNYNLGIIHKQVNPNQFLVFDISHRELLTRSGGSLKTFTDIKKEFNKGKESYKYQQSRLINVLKGDKECVIKI